MHGCHVKKLPAFVPTRCSRFRARKASVCSPECSVREHHCWEISVHVAPTLRPVVWVFSGLAATEMVPPTSVQRLWPPAACFQLAPHACQPRASNFLFVSRSVNGETQSIYFIELLRGFKRHSFVNTLISLACVQ